MFGKQTTIKNSATPEQFGARGDGIHNDTNAIQAAADYAYSNNLDLIISAGIYNISSKITIRTNAYGKGYVVLKPIVNDITVISVTAAKTVIKDLFVSCSKTGITGFEIANSNVLVERCIASGCAIGILNNGYWSNMFRDCQGINGLTGFSAYGHASNKEVNDLKIIGGAYYENSEYALYIGDRRQTGAWQDYDRNHGVTLLMQGFSFDDGIIKIEHMLNVNLINLHGEGKADQDTGIEIGLAGICYSIKIENCFLKTMKRGIVLGSKCRNVTVINNLFTTNTVCCVQVLDRITNINVSSNDTVLAGAAQVYSFGCDSGVTHEALFANVSGNDVNRQNGVKTIYANAEPTTGKWKKGDTAINGSTRYICTSPAIGLGTFSPNTLKPITISGSSVTFTNTADALLFAPGDAISIASGNANAKYIRTIDYIAGTASVEYCDTDGANTISQLAPSFTTI